MNFTMTSLVSLFLPLGVTMVVSISAYALEQYKYLEKWGSFGTYSGNYSKALEPIDKALAIAPDDIYYMNTKAVSSGEFIARLSIEKTVYNITEDQLPFTIPIGLTVSGATFPCLPVSSNHQSNRRNNSEYIRIVTNKCNRG